MKISCQKCKYKFSLYDVMKASAIGSIKCESCNTNYKLSPFGQFILYLIVGGVTVLGGFLVSFELNKVFMVFIGSMLLLMVLSGGCIVRNIRREK